MESQPACVVYCTDTSSLVTIQRVYSRAVFPGIWERVTELAKTGRLAAPREVFNELGQGGDDEICSWARDHKFVFRGLDSEQVAVATEIVNCFKGLVDHDKETPEADPFVVALAVVEQGRSAGRLIRERWVVVADEGLNPPGQKPKIPNVCKDPRYSMECIRTLEMFERERWKFW